MTQRDILPSSNPQSFSRVLRSLSHTGPRKFLEDLALRSKNRYQSSRRVFRDLPDGLALLMMSLQFFSWSSVSIWTILHIFYHENHSILTDALKDFVPLLWQGPFALISAMLAGLLSISLLYYLPIFLIHFISLTVLGFTFYTVLPLSAPFASGNAAALLTLIFLGLYYLRGLRHIPLTAQFLQSAQRICWRNRVSLFFVFFSYAFVSLGYLISWAASILLIQRSSVFNFCPALKVGILVFCVISFMLCGAFFRDLLQIWLSRIIYAVTFANTPHTVIVTSLTRKPSVLQQKPAEALFEPNEGENGNADGSRVAPETAGPEIFASETADTEAVGHNSFDPESLHPDPEFTLEETQRQVSRESMWWCLGTAARSAFHLVLRGFQVHLWILAVIQVFVQWGPPADPQCALDIFHVPTAIYGTSYRKSRRFVGETMVDHGIDRVSVDIYLRIFIYYMLSYACGIIVLMLLGVLLGPDYAFRCNFLSATSWSFITHSNPVHFIVLFVFFGIILVMTAVDSVHMILCWAICESPTSVSTLEPQLMHHLVSSCHTRLDLKRFSGDRIRTWTQTSTQHNTSSNEGK